MRGFGSYHPGVLMAYFAAVISAAMFAGHPVILALALAGGLCFDLLIGKRSGQLKSLLFFACFFAVIAITNPLFSHQGATVLLFINSNPVTLESIFYGMGAGAMIIGVMYWFRNYSIVMTTEKFLFLFGRAMPRLILVFSMVQRFMPLFIRRYKKALNTRKALGGNLDRNIIVRISQAAGVFSMMVTWSMEMAVEMSDSMKARGYGIRKRSSFSLYTFTSRDTVMLIIISVIFLIVLAGLSTGRLGYSYYPYLSAIKTDLTVMPYYAGYACLVFLPAFIEIKENIQWKYLISGI